jgi:hypothetical protein
MTDDRIYPLDPVASDCVGDCDVCELDTAVAYMAGLFVCANERCAAAALACNTPVPDGDRFDQRPQPPKDQAQC